MKWCYMRIKLAVVAGVALLIFALCFHICYNNTLPQMEEEFSLRIKSNKNDTALQEWEEAQKKLDFWYFGVVLSEVASFISFSVLLYALLAKHKHAKVKSDEESIGN